MLAGVEKVEVEELSGLVVVVVEKLSGLVVVEVELFEMGEVEELL